MRRSKSVSAFGQVNTPTPLARRFLLYAALAAVGLWIAWSTAQQWYLDQQLQSRAAALREQNAQIAAQNEAYQRDIAAAGTPQAAQEEARAYGYAQPDEKVYVIKQSPAAAAVPQQRSAAPALKPHREGGLLQNIWRWILRSLAQVTR